MGSLQLLRVIKQQIITQSIRDIVMLVFISVIYLPIKYVIYS